MPLTEFYTLPTDCAATHPSDYLRAMAEAGEAHMAVCGQTMEGLLARGESMMIARSAMHFIHPELRPNQIRTRQIALHGVRAERMFLFYLNDTLVAEAINEYFCVKLETRRVFRPEWFMHPCEPYTGDFQLRRLPIPKEGTLIAEHIVDDACIDYNGHLNNSYYCDYAMEAFGRSDFPQKLYIQYIHELLPHASFTLHCSEDGTVAFGRQGDELSFVALCEDETRA